MKREVFRSIAITMSLAIIAVVVFQIYWNISNYEVLKTRLSNDIQASLDRAIDNYFTELTRENVLDLQFDHRKMIRDTYPDIQEIEIDTIIGNKKFSVDRKLRKLEIVVDDSTMGNHSSSAIEEEHITATILGLGDSVSLSDIEEVSAKVLFALKTDQIDLKKLRGLVQTELSRKNLDIDFQLKQLAAPDLSSVGTNYVKSASPFIITDDQVVMIYTGGTGEILKRGLAGISVSVLTSLFIIATLIYLYRIIKDQKNLAELKNDLISNITHEFKTPISTALSAVEGIQSFNERKDEKKTEKYLNIAGLQLHKLTEMVEKLLETAALDSEQLVLNREEVHPSKIIRQLVEKYEIMDPEKEITVKTEENSPTIMVDPFHFENVLSNVLDNAVKYGGDEISVVQSFRNGHHEITVADNGGNLDKRHAAKVFDKFFRVPSGNVHNVKGYGIGLYHTRKIIEKHGGKIEVNTSPRKTEFNITV
jgi:two-component system phosphate regulon sensor histidine kinase PhoR